MDETAIFKERFPPTVEQRQLNLVLAAEIRHGNADDKMPSQNGD